MVATMPAKKLRAVQRSRRRAEREALMTRSDWLKRAQVAFNRWVKLRDADQPCISCGTFQTPIWDAGHYRTVKAAPELRFDPDNAHRQCRSCNHFMSGNIVEYRLRLVKRIGELRLARLEGPHEPKKYSVDQIREIEREYKRLAKELTRQAAMSTSYGGTG